MPVTVPVFVFVLVRACWIQHKQPRELATRWTQRFFEKLASPKNFSGCTSVFFPQEIFYIIANFFLQEFNSSLDYDGLWPLYLGKTLAHSEECCEIGLRGVLYAGTCSSSNKSDVRCDLSCDVAKTSSYRVITLVTLCLRWGSRVRCQNELGSYLLRGTSLATSSEWSNRGCEKGRAGRL